MENIMKYFIIIYIALINIIAFCMMGIDKHKAKKKKYRIPEKSLFLSAILGGSIGAILGMRYFHHKTLHKQFKYGMPGILIIQIAIVAYVILISTS